MDADAVRMINLVECLAEDYPVRLVPRVRPLRCSASPHSPTHRRVPSEKTLLTSSRVPQDVPPPPDDELPAWSESEVRAYFSSGGSARPEPRDLSVPGGARDVAFGSDPRTKPENAPRVSDATRDATLTSARYRAAAFAHGVPFRANGLFPLGDRLLTELATDLNLRAFQKNVLSYHETPESPDADAVVSYRVAESWAHGDGAARAGLDLRCFYRETSDQNKTGPSLTAAFRLGDGAAIGKFAFTNAHGGSIETVLDETTAELVKCFRAPNCATTELRAKILKPVALHKTYRVDCWIASATQFRLRTEGKITDPEDGTTYATCEATLADLSAIEKSRR
jgi:hypothetical protein